jgi:hypothetical protein
VTATMINDGSVLGRYSGRKAGRGSVRRREADSWHRGGTDECRVQRRRKKGGEEELHWRRALSVRQCPGGGAPKGYGTCVRMEGAEREQVRKGRDGGDAQLLYG